MSKTISITLTVEQLELSMIATTADVAEPG